MLTELRVELKDTNPRIWRTVQVPGSTTLHRLHGILQVVMGWTDLHMYRFHVGGRLYGEESQGSDLKVWDSAKTKLEDIVSEGNLSFLYEYDLGDSWMHQITVLGTVEADEDERPRCTGGARACPPEDCGGPAGYAHFLEAIADPHHEDHDALLEWVGKDFDPEDFDPKLADSTLRRHYTGL